MGERAERVGKRASLGNDICLKWDETQGKHASPSCEEKTMGVQPSRLRPAQPQITLCNPGQKLVSHRKWSGNHLPWGLRWQNLTKD